MNNESEAELTPEQQSVMMKVLWETWQANRPLVPADGNRLFTRWVCHDPENIGWDDWHLIALLKDGELEFMKPEHADHPFVPPIKAAIAAGQSNGRLADDVSMVEWGLFKGDGPAGSRVSDWAKPNE